MTHNREAVRLESPDYVILFIIGFIALCTLL